MRRTIASITSIATSALANASKSISMWMSIVIHADQAVEELAMAGPAVVVEQAAVELVLAGGLFIRLGLVTDHSMGNNPLSETWCIWSVMELDLMDLGRAPAKIFRSHTSSCARIRAIRAPVLL
jgi:hypothetical protein